MTPGSKTPTAASKTPAAVSEVEDESLTPGLVSGIGTPSAASGAASGAAGSIPGSIPGSTRASGVGSPAVSAVGSVKLALGSVQSIKSVEDGDITPVNDMGGEEMSSAKPPVAPGKISVILRIRFSYEISVSKKILEQNCKQVPKHLQTIQFQGSRKSILKTPSNQSQGGSRVSIQDETAASQASLKSVASSHAVNDSSHAVDDGDQNGEMDGTDMVCHSTL